MTGHILRDENRGPVDGFDDVLLDHDVVVAMFAPDDDGMPVDHDPWLDQQLAADVVQHVRADGVAGESFTNLPDAFFTARPVLARIAQAAHSRGRSRDALLGGVLARVAVLVPPTLRLPAIVGSRASLNSIIALLGASGGGKSTALDIAAELVPIDDPDVVVDFPVGSGEGLVDAFLGNVDETDGNGKNVRVRRQVRRAVLAVVDEGQVLADLGGRKGSTLMPTLRSAWSGATIGQGNASVDTNRRVERDAYAFSLVMCVQPAHAVAILDDAAGGTPQRVVWLSATDPTIPDVAPPWPGRLDVVLPSMSYNTLPCDIGVAADVAAEVKARDLARTRGTAVVDPLDAHADLLRLKVAALLGMLDGRRDVGVDDWRLAGLVMNTSRAVRTLIAEHARLDARRREDASTARTVRRELAVADSASSHALERASRAIGRRAHRNSDEPLKRRDISQAIASRDRALVTVDDAVAEAERLAWVVRDGDCWRAGKARPT